MAKYELPIYGKDDELLKNYATNICPWSVYIQAADMQEEMEGKSAREQMDAVGNLLKAVFEGLTEEELLHADAGDVMSTFAQIVNSGQKISKGTNAKNA